MGPLIIYDQITPNTNLFFAFLIGIAFGFILEASGFSSSRKLAGQFYGYDTTVIKVFFTAAITAGLGLLLFGLFGWINLDLIYINPYYKWSTIVGGIIMGAGFILGGFCPGTSFTGVSIGKIDAMIFVAGLFIGIFIFTEGFPLFESLYMAAYKGTPRVSEMMGISDGLFLLGLVVVAFGMFYVAEWAEKKFPLKEGNK